MRIPRVSSVPTGPIVADFSVHASVPSAELCLEDTVADTKGKRKRGGGQNQKWPTSGQGGYINPATWGVPTASERRAESEMAHKWARWLHNPCRLGDPHRFKAKKQNQKWPTSGQGGYINPATWGVPTASERRAESEMAHKWARWLHNPCRLGDPRRFKAEKQKQKWPTSGQGGYITPAA